MATPKDTTTAAKTAAAQPAAASKAAPSVDSQEIVKSIQSHPPIIKLGKVKQKQAKKLKRGKDGSLSTKLMRKSLPIHAELEGNVVPVFISYEEKPRTKPKKKKKKKKINFFGMKIDRKKFKKSLKKNGIRAAF